MTYITNVPQEVLDEIEHITSALPGKVYYSDDGEALILADDGKYIISVEPGEAPFNNGNCTTQSAYLVQEPAECLSTADGDDDPSHIAGWTTGWEC